MLRFRAPWNQAILQELNRRGAYVAYRVPASRELVRGGRVRHCAGAPTTAGATPMFVVAGTGWPKDANGQVTLSYSFGNLTPKLSADDVRQELTRALNAWTAY